MATPEEMAQTMRNNVPEKTGNTFAHWQAIIKESQLEKHGQIVAMLKSEHGMTHGFANLVTSDCLKGNGALYDASAPVVASAPVDLVATQYEKKPNLLPWYQALIEQLESSLGAGAFEIAPKKAYVSLRHKKQFAIIQPSTKTRLDVGVNLKGKPATERLEVSGSFNAMVSHRVRITAVEQIDAELLHWIKEAFVAAG